ncbi:MAG TPA: GtrA family protein [Bacillota bacterium]|nr:GtrA family protein [Bacillota bacterium]HPT87598.1 GtrA family protein [Bacillota bacterium]
MESRKRAGINPADIRKIFYYLVFGVLTTVLSILTYSILVWLNIHYMVSNVLAFVVAVSFAYITNRRWVFKTGEPDKVDVMEFLRFIASRISTLIFESIILFIFITLLEFNPYVVKVIANMIVIFSNYFLSEFIVFKKEVTTTIKEV